EPAKSSKPVWPGKKRPGTRSLGAKVGITASLLGVVVLAAIGLWTVFPPRPDGDGSPPDLLVQLTEDFQQQTRDENWGAAAKTADQLEQLSPVGKATAAELKVKALRHAEDSIAGRLRDAAKESNIDAANERFTAAHRASRELTKLDERRALE